MTDGDRQSLFEANLRLFGLHVSMDVAKLLAGLSSDARLVPADAEAGPNIAVGSARLYPDPADQFSRKQVESYLANPQSLNLKPLDHALDLSDAARLDQIHVKPLLEYAAEHGLFDKRDPECPVGYLVTFGIGLGFHLPDLVSALPVRNLILADQSPVFLTLSLRCVDWHPIFDALQARGGKLICLFYSDPQTLSNQIYHAMRGADQVLLDGSHLFCHYRTAFITQVMELFQRSLPVIADSDGFFEDECLMLTTSVQNLKGQAVEFLKPDVKTRQEVKAGPAVFVVGSGPSIDNDLDKIRAFQGKVTIISGGTGLNVLLEAGIRPDFHCEIENVPDIYTVNADAASRHDLSGITLIASSTVDPRVTAFFDKTYFIFRDQLAPTRLFAPEGLVMPMAGPTVTHLACRVALAMGAGSIYLFGVDLGSTEPDRHHSRRSIYGLSSDAYWRGGAQMEGLNIPTNGNLRERVFTSREFAFARLFFSTLASSTPQVQFYNCSDGVRIEGTEPRAASDIDPEAVDFSGLPAKPALASFQLSETAVDRSFAEILEHFTSGGDAPTQQSEEGDFISLFNGMQSRLTVGSVQDVSASMETARFMQAGSLTMIMQSANMVWGRLPSGRREAFVMLLKAALHDFGKDTAEYFKGLRDA